MSYYDNRHFVNNDGVLDTKTLPTIMNSFITPEIKEHAFSYVFFTAKNQETGVIEESSNTYAIHHFAGSWLSEYEKSVLKATEYCCSKYGNGILGKILLAFLIFFQRFKYEGILNALRYYISNYFFY